MADIHELKEQQEKLVQQAKVILERAEEENRGLTPEEDSEYQKLVEDIQKTQSLIDIKTRELELNNFLARALPDVLAEHVERDVEHAERKTDYRAAWTAYIQRGVVTEELRAQGVGTDTAGGYLVPTDLFDELVRALKYYGPMVDVCRNIVTSSGNTIQVPTVDDTANLGVIVAENTQITEQDVVFGQKALGAYKYTSKLVRVSNELLQDSAFDVAALLEDLFGDRIGRALNAHLTTGTGTGEPEGLITGATKTVSFASLSYDVLVDMIAALDRAYHRGAIWSFSQQTWAAVVKLKDANGLPIFDVREQSILGFPYVINNDQPDIGTVGTKGALALFNPQRYWVRLVRGSATVRRLNERYADFDQVGFVAFLRADGRLVDPNAVVVSQE